jgi:hypothetical protein
LVAIGSGFYYQDQLLRRSLWNSDVILRYRHAPLSGEIPNVGVVLHVPQQRYFGMEKRS